MEVITTAEAARAAAQRITAALETVAEALKASGRLEGLSALIELQRLVLEVTEQQQVLVLENVELQQKLRELRQHVRELEAEKQLAESIVFDGQAYWKQTPSDFGLELEKEGPFCQTCYDKDERWVRLRPGSKREMKWVCSLCGTPVYHAMPPRLKVV